MTRSQRDGEPGAITAAELLVISATAFLVSAIVVSYAMDWIGFRIAPLAVLLAAAAATLSVWRRFRRLATTDAHEIAAFAAIAIGLFAWLLHLAGRSLLPPGAGPDLTHHLMLIDYVEQHRRLPHDPSLGAVLGEMINYTPGTHLLAALAAAWLRSDGVHVVYPIVALTVALKAGVVFLIARRLLPRDLQPMPLAIIAVLLLFVPYTYFVRSFSDTSYLAQVVSEFFAVVMLWAVVAWADAPGRRFAAVFATAGVGAFLNWPLWIGPLAIAFAAVAASRRDVATRERAVALAIAGVPIAIVAAIHMAGRLQAASIVAVGGYVPYPTVDTFGRWFVAAGVAGLVIAAWDRRSRTIVWLVAAIVIQSAALYVLAKRSGAERPYQALKMVFLLIYPFAIAGALAIAAAVRPLRRAVWPLTIVIAVLVGRAVVRAPRPTPIVTEPLYQAGRWTRENLPVDCIDYLVANDYSAYWLHHAVLRNPRADPRKRDELFESKKAIVRWVLPGGRPYAIVQDLEAIPRDARTNLDLLARFGAAAVVKRRGQSRCD